MSQDGIPSGAVSKRELAELAGLFDRFQFAFDPESLEAREAEAVFDQKLGAIFEERVKPKYPNFPFAVFYNKTKTLCRQFIKKNIP